MPARREEAAVEHAWRFRIGDAFPADDPVARFIVAVGGALNDNLLSNTLFVEAQRDHERTYFFYLASSHLYESSETLRQAHREWESVRAFVAALDDDRQQEFERVVAVSDPGARWPSNRLKEIRNSFFHYLRLDAAAANARQLPLMRGGPLTLDLSATGEEDRAQCRLETARE